MLSDRILACLRNSCIAALACVASLTSVACQAEPASDVASSAPGALRGPIGEATAYPFAVVINGDASSPRCTGSLVSDRVVLTARHCLGRGAGSAILAPYAAAGGRQATAIRAASFPAEGDEGLDVGVLVLDTPIALTEYPVVAERALDADTVLPESLSLLGRRRGCPSSGPDGDRIYVQALTTIRVHPRDERLYWINGITQPGDSGGALVGVEGGKTVVYSVTSKGDPRDDPSEPFPTDRFLSADSGAEFDAGCEPLMPGATGIDRAGIRQGEGFLRSSLARTDLARTWILEQIARASEP